MRAPTSSSVKRPVNGSFASLLIFLVITGGFLLYSPPTRANEGSFQLEMFPWVYCGWDEDTLLLRFDGLRPGNFEIFEIAGPSRIVLDVPYLVCEEDNPVYEAVTFPGMSLIRELRASCTSEGVRIVLESRYQLYWEIVTSDELGLDVLVYLRFRQTVEEIALDTGTVYVARRYVSPSGQRYTHAVISDPSASRLRPFVYKAGDIGSSHLTTITNFVNSTGAAAGINGGYYMWPGISLSLVIQEGVIAAPPMLHRPAFMILENGTYSMDYPPVRGVVTSESGQRIDIDLVNQVPRSRESALLTPGHPSRLRDQMTGRYCVIKDNVIEYIGDGEIEDFSDRYVIWSKETFPAFDYFYPGEAVEISYYVEDGLSRIYTAIQGGPFLLKNGVVDVTIEEDDIGRDIAHGRAARTAIGYDDFGRLYLVCVDGSGTGRSIGATLQELAWTMLDLGATWAINLDGGSSTGMALGYTVPENGLPSGGRQIATSILLIDESGNFQGQRFFF